MVERTEWRRDAWPTGRRGMAKRCRGAADAGAAESSDERRLGGSKTRLAVRLKRWCVSGDMGETGEDVRGELGDPEETGESGAGLTSMSEGRGGVEEARR
jgi:hypothetical protein